MPISDRAEIRGLADSLADSLADRRPSFESLSAFLLRAPRHLHATRRQQHATGRSTQESDAYQRPPRPPMHGQMRAVVSDIGFAVVGSNRWRERRALPLPRLADFTFMERSRDGQEWVSILN